MRANVRLLTTIGLLLASLSWDACLAADFRFRDAGQGTFVLELSGEIIPGDAKNLETALLREPQKYLSARSISLNSPGGSVTEAMKIGEVLREAGIGAVVEPKAICASSCFLIWISADFHTSLQSSRIIVHRPYLPQEKVTLENFAAASETTGQVLLAMREFLVAKNVPGSLIDKMMKLPSNEGYEIPMEELIDLGFMSPVLEEKAIHACGVSNSSEVTGRAAREAGICVPAIIGALRPHYLIKKLGTEAALDVISRSNRRTIFVEGKEIEIPAAQETPPGTTAGRSDFGIPGVESATVVEPQRVPQVPVPVPTQADVDSTFFDCTKERVNHYASLEDVTVSEVVDAALVSCQKEWRKYEASVVAKARANGDENPEWVAGEWLKVFLPAWKKNLAKLVLDARAAARRATPPKRN